MKAHKSDLERTENSQANEMRNHQRKTKSEQVGFMLYLAVFNLFPYNITHQ